MLKRKTKNNNQRKMVQDKIKTKDVNNVDLLRKISYIKTIIIQ